MPTVSEDFAALLAAISYDLLPSNVVAEAKRRVLDTLGCAIGGRAGDSSQIALDLVRSLGGRAQCTIVGERGLTSPPLAAFCNAALIRYLDYQDSHPGIDPAHPSGSIAGLLAIAEAQGSSGRALIEAIVIAYEAIIRVQRAVKSPGIAARGWHNATFLGFGVPLGAARLVQLDPPAWADALGISVAHASTLDQLRHGQIPNSKGVADAWVVKTGVEAVLLAAHGLRGAREVVEGRWGFASAVANGLDQDILLAPLDHYSILETHTKRYACVGSAQSAVAALLELRAKGLRAEDVVQVEVGLTKRLSDNLSADPGKFDPRSKETADHSLPYCAAVALLEGEVGPAQFTPEKYIMLSVRKLMKKIVLAHNPDLDVYWPGSTPASLTVRTRHGQEFRAEVPYPPGHHRTPLSDGELIAKFRALCEGQLPRGRIAAIQERVARLETLENVAELTELLRW